MLTGIFDYDYLGRYYYAFEQYIYKNVYKKKKEKKKERKKSITRVHKIKIRYTRIH